MASLDRPLRHLPAVYSFHIADPHGRGGKQQVDVLLPIVDIMVGDSVPDTTVKKLPEVISPRRELARDFRFPRKRCCPG